MRLRSALAGLLATFTVTSSAAAQQSPSAPAARRGTPIKPGTECPAGSVEIRPLLCETPELPAPSIVDYRPRSTLVKIGAYGETWPDIHLTPEQAVDAHAKLRGRLLLPLHWGRSTSRSTRGTSLPRVATH